MSENAHFLHEELWQDYDPGGNIMRYKVPMVLQNIPEDVQRIIDVGCGNGIITNVLNEKYQVVGADLSAEALKQVKGERLQCSCDALPVEDNSFDMVFSSQLIEHLPDDTLKATLGEFKRVARKYILITVPNGENLGRNEVKCSECGEVFSCIGHLQSFNQKHVGDLLGPGYTLVNSEVSGALYRNYSPWLMNIRQDVGNRYFNTDKFTICPACQNTEFPSVKGNLVSKVCNGLDRVISRKKPYWLLALFEKQQ